MNQMADELIRVPKAAALLGCCERIVWELLAAGELTRYKLPKRRITVVSLREVLKYIELVKGGEHASIS
jgi:predicted DNA-binding transcriptional regulator AlpA